MDTAPRIKTTTVGSYPVPAWLGNSPSEQDITDATRVILHTQETAGLDVVCDGEVYRYDLSHPETNGMIEYFTAPMEGIRSALTFDLIRQFESDMNMGWRRLPAGVVETHRSLFDGSLEGLRLDGKPVFSVQYHPEASPGPQDSHYLFKRFVALMDEKD